MQLGYIQTWLFASQVWIVGGIRRVRSLSLRSHCLLGAMHPALLETSAGNLAPNASCKVYSRGYSAKSYLMPTSGALDEELSQDRI